MTIATPRGRLRLVDLNNRLPNAAESLPWPQPVEPHHIGSTFRAPAPVREVDPEYERDRAELLAELVDAQRAWQSQWQQQELPERVEGVSLLPPLPSWARLHERWPTRFLPVCAVLFVLLLVARNFWSTP